MSVLITILLAVIITQAFRIRRLKKEIIKRDTADEFSRQWYWIEDKNNKQRQPLKKRKSLLSFFKELFMSFSKSKPSNYVTKEQIERARNVDMVEFLERTEGFSVKKSGNGYRCDKHDSLFITNDRRGWYWNSRDEGGNNAIAFCMKIYGQSFTEAVKSLCGDIQIEYTPNKITSKPSVSKDKESNRLILPEQDHKENGQRNYSNVIAYLCKTRGLEYSIVNQLIYDRKLYQGVGYSGLQLVGYDSSNTPFYRFKNDVPENAPEYVTVELQAQKQKGEKYICEGFSSEHIPELIERGITKKYVNMIAVNGDGVMSRYAFCRSVSDKSTYRVDLPGSDKKYSFSLIGTNKNKLYVFESVIDMLSYASFYAIRNGQDSWQELTMISLGGKSDVALDEFLQNNPITEITLCLDNDEAGRHASAQLSDKYALKGYTISNDIPLNKDFNDDLKAFRALEEKSTIQTTTKPLRR